MFIIVGVGPHQRARLQVCVRVCSLSSVLRVSLVLSQFRVCSLHSARQRRRTTETKEETSGSSSATLRATSSCCPNRRTGAGPEVESLCCRLIIASAVHESRWPWYVYHSERPWLTWHTASRSSKQVHQQPCTATSTATSLKRCASRRLGRAIARPSATIHILAGARASSNRLLSSATG
jgi:hypothetical protein